MGSRGTVVGTVLFAGIGGGSRFARKEFETSLQRKEKRKWGKNTGRSKIRFLNPSSKEQEEEKIGLKYKYMYIKI